jgi:RNA polymerase sigma-70 factor (ECF subfamily)
VPEGSNQQTPVTDEGPDPDTALMLSVRAGDERAFATLVRRWQNRIVSLAYRYLRSAADAEDLAQEVFLRVYRAKETYEPKSRFSTWIFRITVNASLNQLRARRTRKAITGTTGAGGGIGGIGGINRAGLDDDNVGDAPDDSAPDPAEETERDELAKVLRRIVDGLPERQRTAILLNKYEGLSYEECAEAMDLSLMALKSLLTRARVAIREKIEPYLDEGATSP